MASSSSFSSRNWAFDVFPSFSGEDVRKRFLSHFLRELDRKLIVSFKDNEIERSQSLDPELKQAIRTSRIAVVIFSKSYTSSSWCLNELLEIVKCKKEFGQLVIPIFYDLDPSHVRKQTGEFGMAFEKTCQNKTAKEIQSWCQALTDVANVLGFHSQNWDDEGKMIEAIANDVLSKLNLSPSKDFEDFVGMEDHIAKMSGLLQLESEEVRMVGIWGSSGIGKTTIARALYSQLSRQFQGSIFIDRAFVSKSTEIYKTANPDDYNMKLHLLRSFLSEILDKKDLRIDHLSALEERLKHKKILIFIDDLDDQVVLDTLAGQSHWFGRGSRIIVITKDKHFLRAHGIDHVYEVCLPSKEHALEIFCRSAFKKDSPPDGLMDIVSEVASRAGNLPLGLNVLGSYLRGRDKEDWMEMLPSLRNRLNGKIEKTLRISYDGLNNKKDEAIFRHVACLFNGEKIDDIKQLLAKSDLDVNFGINNLVEKSLVHVTRDIVTMHSVLLEMGKEIVRAQSNEPGEREFLVDSKDICDVLEHNTGTKKVLGIALDMDETDELHIHESAFKVMQNLIFLNIHTKKRGVMKEVKWHLLEGLNYLPPKLRLLSLHGYPMQRLPSNFRSENLVKLEMRWSKLEKLWEGVHKLPGLKEMNLEGSVNLKEIPDLSMATNLKKLCLNYCSSLVELPSSIQYLNKLIVLTMHSCKNLQTLPTGMNLESLYELELSWCSRLRTFPEISTNISNLGLSGTAIEEFPSNICLDNLHYLFMFKMSEKLWNRVQLLTPFMTMLSHSLEILMLSNIPSLVEIPSFIQHFPILEDLKIADCINLDIIPTGINLKSLDRLNLQGCSRLRSFPNISRNISVFFLDRTGIEEVPWWIEKFSRLHLISMTGCKNLRNVSLYTSKLKHLIIADFSDCGALTEVRLNDSLSGVIMEADNIHSPLVVSNEASSSLSDCYFPKVKINLTNCPNLDQEAMIQQQTFSQQMRFSGEEVPSYFTHRTTGISLTIPLLHTFPSQQFFKFKVCTVLDTGFLPICHFPLEIKVCCRFIDRHGNHFDSVELLQLFDESETELDSHIFIADLCFLLNKDNACLAQLNYDHVDIQLPIIFGNSWVKIKEWGVRVFNDCSSPENPLDNPDVCEDNEDNISDETRHGEEYEGIDVETERSSKRIRSM